MPGLSQLSLYPSPSPTQRQSSFVGRTATSSLHKVGSSNLGVGRSYVFGSDMSNSHMPIAVDASRDPHDAAHDTKPPVNTGSNNNDAADLGAMTFAGVKSLTNLRNSGSGGNSNAPAPSLFNLLGSSSGGRQVLKPLPSKAHAATATAAAASDREGGGKGAHKRDSSGLGGGGGKGATADGGTKAGSVGPSKGKGENSAAEDARMGEAMAAVAARFPTNVAAATHAQKRR